MGSSRFGDDDLEIARPSPSHESALLCCVAENAVIWGVRPMAAFECGKSACASRHLRTARSCPPISAVLRVERAGTGVAPVLSPEVVAAFGGPRRVCSLLLFRDDCALDEESTPRHRRRRRRTTGGTRGR